MKMFKTYLSAIVLMSVIFMGSCKKDEETNGFPDITFFTPNSGAVYNMFDSVSLTAHVSDASGLRTVGIKLTTLNRTPVQQNISYYPNGTDLDIDLKYVLYEFHLESGYYYLTITASNENNST